MVDVILDSDDLDTSTKTNCWSFFTLGTDFEGYIDPTQDYGNALQFDDFEKDLLDKLEGLRVLDGARYHLTSDEKVEAAARAICFENAHRFLERHF